MNLLATVACAIALATLATFVIGGPSKPVPLPPPRPLPRPPPAEVLEARWPKPVQTVSFMQAALQSVPQPAVVMTSAPQLLPIRIKREIKRERKTFAYDICHGKGRYFTNNGKSWRCRRD